jgi:hypothetical protein
MTVVEPGGTLDMELQRDLDELRKVLEHQPFPAQQDDLMAACLGRGEPVRLCVRLSNLDRTRVYPGVDDVLEEVAASAEGSGRDEVSGEVSGSALR